MMLLDSLARQALFTLDPETAHGVSIAALKTGVLPGCRANRDPRLSQTLAGLTFPNPLGIAAGYDKNAEVTNELARLGFGFVEAGTITPLPQSGNPKPRIFRLVNDRAVINRLGFNNEGHAAALKRLEGRQRAGLTGINIGANKDSDDRIGDYVKGIAAFAHLADYFTVNISSPNTPGLRNLQTRASLAELLSRVMEELARKGRSVPVFLKIAPDLVEGDLDDIAAECQAQALSGIIVSNTTLARAGLSDHRQAQETGGMSGAPLFERSTIVLAKMRDRVGPDMILIGAGGVSDAGTAAEKIRAGADLVQLYTGFIYGGIGLPGRIVRGLSRILDRDGLTSISQLRGQTQKEWASKAIPE